MPNAKSQIRREIEFGKACDDRVEDLRVRIEDEIARVDQRKLQGEIWEEIDEDVLPVTEHWRTSGSGGSAGVRARKPRRLSLRIR
jgi:hypothetical protein